VTADQDGFHVLKSKNTNGPRKAGLEGGTQPTLPDVPPRSIREFEPKKGETKRENPRKPSLRETLKKKREEEEGRIKPAVVLGPRKYQVVR